MADLMPLLLHLLAANSLYYRLPKYLGGMQMDCLDKPRWAEGRERLREEMILIEASGNVCCFGENVLTDRVNVITSLEGSKSAIWVGLLWKLIHIQVNTVEPFPSLSTRALARGVDWSNTANSVWIMFARESAIVAYFAWPIFIFNLILGGGKQSNCSCYYPKSWVIPDLVELICIAANRSE